ncbi:MAG TPA: NADH-quinone oxidoreductase subunit C [Pyrinomonadaceae bacterium]|jgi:NADH-quinone oxidoreductase subunit C|nr:NADH-quinone oxidoreductase subunit C [Pyrinomonadaceae bacterium]
MPEDTKQPGSEEPAKPDASVDTSGTPPPSAIPPAGELAGADAEKAAMVEQAKSRVAAVKEGLATQPAAPAEGTPKPPVKKKDEGPKPTDASSHPLVKQLKAKFGEAIGDASEFLGQLSVNVAGDQIVAICNFLKNDKKTPFDYLSDLTCVHYPDNKQTPFDVVYNLYSISENERVRLKVKTSEEGVESVTSVWPAANWLEREVFDLFGVQFKNHPDLRRLLLPPDWEGYPLRKDFPLEFVENAWTAKHLPEMSDVQVEQIQQRRVYGLEILSVPQERMMRDIFRGGKEVMTKDK